MQSFFILFSTFFIFLSSAAGAENVRTGDPNEIYPFVGYGDVGRPQCTYSIVRHGLLITAKHCFRRQVPASKLSVTFPGGLTINKGQFQEIIMDPGVNDIAWATYPPDLTQAIELPIIHIAGAKPTMETILEMPGSPSRNPRPFINVTSCGLTGKEGYFPALPRDPGYEGLLLEMNCPAWFGQSGSPVYEVSDTGEVTLYGILSHTFNVTVMGDVDMTKAESDQFGTFVRQSIFSPIYLNEYLKIIKPSP